MQRLYVSAPHTNLNLLHGTLRLQDTVHLVTRRMPVQRCIYFSDFNITNSMYMTSTVLVQHGAGPFSHGYGTTFGY